MSTKVVCENWKLGNCRLGWRCPDSHRWRKPKEKKELEIVNSTPEPEIAKPTTKTLAIVFGWIREKISDRIPLDIIRICVSFYNGNELFNIIEWNIRGQHFEQILKPTKLSPYTLYHPDPASLIFEGIQFELSCHVKPRHNKQSLKFYLDINPSSLIETTVNVSVKIQVADNISARDPKSSPRMLSYDITNHSHLNRFFVHEIDHDFENPDEEYEEIDIKIWPEITHIKYHSMPAESRWKWSLNGSEMCQFRNPWAHNWEPPAEKGITWNLFNNWMVTIGPFETDIAKRMHIKPDSLPRNIKALKIDYHIELDIDGMTKIFIEKDKIIDKDGIYIENLWFYLYGDVAPKQVHWANTEQLSIWFHIKIKEIERILVTSDSLFQSDVIDILPRDSWAEYGFYQNQTSA